MERVEAVKNSTSLMNGKLALHGILSVNVDTVVVAVDT